MKIGEKISINPLQIMEIVAITEQVCYCKEWRPSVFNIGELTKMSNELKVFLVSDIKNYLCK
jgi:hypothetical protein